MSDIKNLPIGTSDFKVFDKNVSSLDVAISDTQKEHFEDRKEVERYTYHGMERRADRLMTGFAQRSESILNNLQAAYGWHQIDYIAGNEITTLSDFIIVPGEGQFSIKPSTPLPYILNGDWAVDQQYFGPISDAPLRADLADPEKGAGYIGFALSSIYPKNSVGEILLLANNSVFYVDHYYSQNDGVDYGPAVRAAYAAAEAAGGGTVMFPPRKIDIYSVGDDPKFVIPIMKTDNNVIHTVGWGSQISSVRLFVDASEKSFFGTSNTFSGGSFKDITIAARKNAKHALYIADEYAPILVLDCASFIGGTETAATISTYLAEFRSSYFSESKRGLRLQGVRGEPVTSVTMTSCYARDNEEIGYSFGLLTYCSLVSCAADRNELAYSFDAARGVSMLGCGVEYGRRGILFKGYRGVTIDNFYGLNIGSEQNPSDYFIEFQGGFGGVVSGIIIEGQSYYNYKLASTSLDYGSESITVLDNTVRRDQVYQVATWYTNRPIRLLVDEKSRKNETINVSTAEQLIRELKIISDYEINHRYTINIADGSYDLSGSSDYILSRVTGCGELIIIGNTSNPSAVTITSNGKFNFQKTAISLRIVGCSVKNTVNSDFCIGFSGCFNVAVDSFTADNAGTSTKYGIYTERGNRLVIGSQTVISGTFSTARTFGDYSSVIQDKRT